MRVFEFNQAIVRKPGGSVVNGLRSNPRAVPDTERLAAEHAAYVAALQAVGLAVEISPPLEAFPDSVFVEDPALVLPEAAILLRPGAPSRLGETTELRGTLRRRFTQVLELRGGEHADGGDVLVTPDVVFIGLSQRTDRAGAEALSAHLSSLGRKATTVETPASVLHLKSAASLIRDDTLLLTAEMAASGIFSGFRAIIVLDGEAPAANALRINDVVFMDACFPRTVDLVRRDGLTVRQLAVTETAKLDAGLSCMSLRWQGN